MLFRAFWCLALTAFLMLLVWLQIWEARRIGWAMTEQLISNGLVGRPIERHYAMPFDTVVVAPFVGLAVFLCWPQWKVWDMTAVAISSAVVATLLGWFWYHLPNKEAHNQSVVMEVLLCVFLAVAVWTMVMVALRTPRPEPVLLLFMAAILPAFLFLGEHMFFDILNKGGIATSYNDRSINNPIAWVILIAPTLALWWRTRVLIPQSFWDSLR